MEKCYTKKCNDWMMYQASIFLRNLLMNHQEEVEDNDVFEILLRFESREKILSRLYAVFSKEERESMGERTSVSKRKACIHFNEDSIPSIFQDLWNKESDRPRVKKVLFEMIEDYQASKSLPQLEQEVFPQRLQELKRVLGLSEVEINILLVSVFIRVDLLEFPIRCRRYDLMRADTFAKYINCDSDEVLKGLSGKERLRRYHCVDDDGDVRSNYLNFLYGMDEETLSNQFFKESQEEILPWSFYGDLAQKHGEILKSLIRASRGESRMNILLYGAPGTGKTSFARTLAHELGLKCYFINQDTGCQDRACSGPEHRFGALQICNNQVERMKSLIVVDEADQMLSGGNGFFSFFGIESTHGDKGLLNDVLDAVKTPTIWITNSRARALDPSSRRRFDYSIKFEPLTMSQRLSIWQNNVAKFKLKPLFPQTLLARIANRYQVSAGGIALTVQNIAKLKPAKKEVEALVEKLMTPHCELLEVPTTADKLKPARDYTLKGLNIKGFIQLPQIEEAIRNFQSGKAGGMDRPRMNLLLSGPPGTGKTEFVKYLGQVLETRVSVKMGSDILDMYVGGTEQNIKRAFVEAEAEKSILFLDEIDGLVQSRAGAQRSWEVTQVNELLYQMENFKGVMIGATNFSQNLDAAILRRFTFKLEFDYLTEEGKEYFFEQMFQVSLTAAEKARLKFIPNLAPGDFRTVRQSLFYLGGKIINADRLAALEQESRAKGDYVFSPRAQIGF